MKTVKEIEKELTDKVNNFVECNYKREALKELKEIEELGKSCPNCEFIVKEYPSFNSIVFKIQQPEHFVLSIAVNYKDLVGEPRAIHKAAKLVHSWLKMGGKEHEN